MSEKGGIMKKKIIVLGFMIVSGALLLPTEGFAGTAGGSASLTSTTNNAQISVTIGQPRRRRVFRNGGWTWVTYRNYGQYRRNNRRYRMVRRYYSDDGIRRVRWVRVY